MTLQLVMRCERQRVRVVKNSLSGRCHRQQQLRSARCSPTRTRLSRKRRASRAARSATVSAGTPFRHQADIHLVISAYSSTSSRTLPGPRCSGHAIPRPVRQTGWPPAASRAWRLQPALRPLLTAQRRRSPRGSGRAASAATGSVDASISAARRVETRGAAMDIQRYPMRSNRGYQVGSRKISRRCSHCGAADAWRRPKPQRQQYRLQHQRCSCRRSRWRGNGRRRAPVPATAGAAILAQHLPPRPRTAPPPGPPSLGAGVTARLLASGANALSIARGFRNHRQARPSRRIWPRPRHEPISSIHSMVFVLFLQSFPGRPPVPFA